MIIKNSRVPPVNNFHHGYEIVTCLDQKMKDFVSEENIKILFLAKSEFLNI